MFVDDTWIQHDRNIFFNEIGFWLISSDILGSKLTGNCIFFSFYFVFKIWPTDSIFFFFFIFLVFEYIRKYMMGGIFVCFTVQKYYVLFWFLIVDKQNICDIKQLIRKEWNAWSFRNHRLYNIFIFNFKEVENIITP